MNGWLSLILISIAVSLDGFGVGMTYGMRKLKIPVSSLLVIAVCSFAVVYSVVSLGNSLTAWLTAEMSNRIGAAVLILIGTITLWRMWKKEEPNRHNEARHEHITQFRIFGLIIQILKDPERADADQSGHIVGWEAVTLGLALSLDAFGAGISLSLLGNAPILVASCVAICSVGLLFLGITVGARFANQAWFSKISWLPPILLIFIGIIKTVS